MKFRPSNATLRTQAFAAAVGAALLGGTLPCSSAFAQFTASPMDNKSVTAGDTPRQLEGVGITEHLGETIPLELTFTDETGKPVRLSDLFKPGRPVILTLNYYRCPMLCTLTLNGMVDALNELDWSAGKEFEIITVSINPDEGPDLADVKKQAYLTQYKPKSGAGGSDSVKAGWHFLTGDSHSIERLTKSVGFGYRFDPITGDYAHTSTIMFVTPEGKLSRYINDVKFEPKTVKLALIEASEGAIGSPMDKFLLFMCFHYDPLRGGYAASAVKIMKMGGALTLVLLAAGVGVLWMRGSSAQVANQMDVGNGESSNLSNEQSLQPHTH